MQLLDVAGVSRRPAFGSIEGIGIAGYLCWHWTTVAKAVHTARMRESIRCAVLWPLDLFRVTAVALGMSHSGHSQVPSHRKGITRERVAAIMGNSYIEDALISRI
jgi:hypothetical protein